jgi:hypothetical protein
LSEERCRHGAQAEAHPSVGKPKREIVRDAAEKVAPPFSFLPQCTAIISDSGDPSLNV